MITSAAFSAICKRVSNSQDISRHNRFSKTYHVSGSHREEARVVGPRAHVNDTEIRDAPDLEVSVENGVWIYDQKLSMSEVTYR